MWISKNSKQQTKDHNENTVTQTMSSCLCCRVPNCGISKCAHGPIGLSRRVCLFCLLVRPLPDQLYLLHDNGLEREPRSSALRLLSGCQHDLFWRGFAPGHDLHKVRVSM